MGDLGEALGHSVRELIAAHPLWAIAAIMFAEELGIPSPVPSDFLMLLAGIQVRRGGYPFWAVLLVQEAATLAGTTGLFLFSRRFGRAAVARYGWLIHLGPTTLARAERAMQRSGGRAVLAGRLIPGLRIVTPIAADVRGMGLREFLPAVALGSLLLILAFNLVEFFAGSAALALFERVPCRWGRWRRWLASPSPSPWSGASSARCRRSRAAARARRSRRAWTGC